MRRTPNRRLSSVESTPSRPGPSTAAPSPQHRPDGPAAAAHAALRAAQSALADAEGAVRVAQAQLADTLAASPQENAAVARATEEVESARAKADAAASAVRAAERAVEDRVGAVQVAEAKRADVVADDPTDVKIVEATERRDKAVRAEDAAREAVLEAHQNRDTAENQLAAAEERLAQAREMPPRETAAVVAAREKVAKTERARELAEERVGAARAAYDRAVALEAGEDSPAASAPLFASLPTFVDRYVLPNWRHQHQPNSTRWCERWWLHEEAVTRLEALWEAFEAMRLEPAPSLSTWLRDHFDHHMSMLTRIDGPFANCQPRRHDEPVHEAVPVWPHTEPPAGLFDVDPESVVQPQSQQQGGVA